MISLIVRQTFDGVRLLDLLPKRATSITTTMMATRPPLLGLKEEPSSEPEAPALVSTALPDPASPLSDALLLEAVLLGEDEMVDVACIRVVGCLLYTSPSPRD